MKRLFGLLIASSFLITSCGSELSESTIASEKQAQEEVKTFDKLTKEFQTFLDRFEFSKDKNILIRSVSSKNWFKYHLAFQHRYRDYKAKYREAFFAMTPEEENEVRNIYFKVMDRGIETNMVHKSNLKRIDYDTYRLLVHSSDEEIKKLFDKHFPKK